ncbi:MAG: acetyl-CoA C-acyltransferase [Bacteroidetes bacterium]|nr:acetyl-CoA C-acyltransferase [Bacteroidota bacterium]MBV6460156.1 Acetyl-CoA acetyltransferase [Flavobacteriales bacterium]WKZ74028.1 MAG: acetyl-CoA C-acyltransferase [Vicingaceae bacterium]MCL4817398.1 acetyl-CoA C-acyltransferase [Flavobacteriales bacterium]NOG96064.1 acetyl-CoA C-acyltransferase [Bacteroidota bacterium]
MKEVYIVSAVRTPIGSFNGSLAGVSSSRLGATAIKGALNKINLNPAEVKEVLMGCVLQAGLGQAPARQAAKFAGLPDSTTCTTINKVCASGMKAVSLAAQSIILGDADVVIAGGMENMSQVPHYLQGSRNGFKLGDAKLTDGLILDGLMDVYNNIHMGNCAELCAKEKKFTREEQDAFAIESYKRAAAAWQSGKFKEEIIPVEIPQKKGDSILFTEDEEYKNVKFDKIPQLASVFQKDGTVTAANASTLNDGAAALILMSKEKMQELNLKPLARIIASADAEQAPEWFTTSPTLAINKALKKANLTTKDIQYWELNQAFSVVGLANIKELGLNPKYVDVNGGAVALGHPLGCSGARIIVTLLNVLQQNNAKLGAAAICNGGGGASSIIIERL